MAYSTFPAYAQFLLDGYEQRASASARRTEMEDGYVHQAPANSLTRHEHPVSYRLTSRADKESFESWRSGTLRGGALWFAWPDPSDPFGMTQLRARIVKGEVTYKPLTNTLTDWQVSFTLEYWA